VEYYPEIPLHILYLTMKKVSGGVSAQDVVDTIGNQIGEFGVYCIYTFGSKEAQYEKKIGAVEKAKIYGD
jgi:hypothetical protein